MKNSGTFREALTVFSIAVPTQRHSDLTRLFPHLTASDCRLLLPGINYSQDPTTEGKAGDVDLGC